MRAIFYDRKNRREVSNDQLMPVNVVRSIAVGREEDLQPTGRRYEPSTGEPLTFLEICKPDRLEFMRWKEEKTLKVVSLLDETVGTLGYKSESCPANRNWDLFLTESDLIFLRMEE